MKQLLTELKISTYPFACQMILVIMLASVVVLGVLGGQKVQAISSSEEAQSGPVLFPANQALMVNPDVQLKLTFNNTPRLGTSGKIRIYDASSDQLVDTLLTGEVKHQLTRTSRHGISSDITRPNAKCEKQLGQILSQARGGASGAFA